MKPYKQRTGISTKRPVINRIEGLHPYKTIAYLLISVSCILYAFLSFMFIKYLAINLEGNFQYNIPKFFTVSTLLLLSCVYFISKVKDSFTNDDIHKLRKLLSYTLILGLLFFISQSVAWMEMLAHEENFTENQITTYVFTFSVINLGFVLVGMIMSGILFYRYMIIENDPVKTLIATTNPIESVKLDIYKVLWNFNVISWTLIFLMFLFIF